MIGSYTISIRFKNAGMMAKQAEKMKDFSALFRVIENLWVEHNKDKFDKARGAQEMGVSFPDGIFWEELSEKYLARKEAQGYDDWLMVKSGALMRSLTDRGTGWFDIIEPMAAYWGTELPEAGYNFESRPTVFLDPVDRKNIVDTLYKWLEDMPPFMGGKLEYETMAGAE